jgi:anthranilate phosphoribosyltransferase
MSNAFRELLRKIGSGPHTGQNLTREEAAAATRMMLLAEATPAQIGAFLIAHRIKRPTGEELAGMLDAYDELGPKLQPIKSLHPVTVMGIPYDGRSRTAPVSPLIALILAAANCPVVLHGGKRMPTKEGEPLVNFWQELGIDWTTLSLDSVQKILEQTGLGFLYLPTHFPLAESLVPFREQIGKRPPLSTLELIWSPYRENLHLVSGFVHPPTEMMFRDALMLRGTLNFTTVKGLEGSCDLPRERTAIIGLSVAPTIKGATPISQILDSESEAGFERLHLHPRDYGFEGKNVPLNSVSEVVTQMQATIAGQPSNYMRSVIWNGGFYLWRCGASPDLSKGFELAEASLRQGKAAQKLQEVQQAIAQQV